MTDAEGSAYRTARFAWAQARERLEAGERRPSRYPRDDARKREADLEEATRAMDSARDRLIRVSGGDGADQIELEVWIREVDYTAEIVAMSFDLSIASTEDHERAIERQKELITELHGFWISTGHSMVQLDALLTKADRLASDLLPK